MGEAEEAAFARRLQQHLGDHQAEQLVVADQLRPTPARSWSGRKQRTSSAINCDQEGVEVGAHVGLQVNGLQTPPTFDTFNIGPCYPAPKAPAVNCRSII